MIESSGMQYFFCSMRLIQIIWMSIMDEWLRIDAHVMFLGRLTSVAHARKHMIHVSYKWSTCCIRCYYSWFTCWRHIWFQRDLCVMDGVVSHACWIDHRNSVCVVSGPNSSRTLFSQYILIVLIIGVDDGERSWILMYNRNRIVNDINLIMFHKCNDIHQINWLWTLCSSVTQYASAHEGRCANDDLKAWCLSDHIAGVCCNMFRWRTNMLDRHFCFVAV